VSPPSPPPLPQPTHLPADGDENDVAAAATSDDEENIRCRRYLYLTHDELESSDWCGDLSRLLSPADAEVVPSDNDAGKCAIDRRFSPKGSVDERVFDLERCLSAFRRFSLVVLRHNIQTCLQTSNICNTQ